jgi:phosphate transport system protein
MTQESRHFADELERLNARLLDMGRLVENRLGAAMRALTESDPNLIAELMLGDEPVNHLQLEIDDRCFKLLALYQPMAVDLRTIVSVVKINADLERVGDLAVNIAEAAQRYIQHPPVKPLIDLPQMGQLAQQMLHDALDAFVTRSVPKAQLVLSEDDRLDALKDQIFRELLTYMLGNPKTIEPGIDLVLIARHLERVGDHATNIAEDVIFIVDARDVRHGSAIDSS